MIVPIPWALEIVALVGFDRFTKKVSFGSLIVSPLTTTVMVFEVSPALKFTVPVVPT